MFWSTHTTSYATSETSDTPAAPREGRGPVSERLRDQLQERLMLALEFATLGAYELTAPEGDASLAPASADLEPRPAEHRRERPQRVFLFAKAVPACSQSDSSGRPRCNSAADVSLRGSGRRRGRKRGGSVKAA